MYRKLIRPLFFLLPIERAHRLALLLLRLIGLLPGGWWLLERCFAVRHPALEREVFGVRFQNPVGVAAGFDVNGEVFRELGHMGFGFVEVGTITPQPQTGNPKPRIFRLKKDAAIINRIGLSNRGLARAIHKLRRNYAGVVVGCNIGRNITTPVEKAPNDFLKCFRNLYQYADYFTINLCCDNNLHDSSSHAREHILAILEPLFDFRRGQNQYRPVMLKISPDLTDEEIDRVTDILIETPLDGIVAVNGTHQREGLNTSLGSITSIGGGRLSGPALRERMVEIVRRVHTRSGGGYPIIAAGGICSADDVRAVMEAGADLVQIYTGWVYEGPKLVQDICHALVADATAEQCAPETTSANSAEPSEPSETPETPETPETVETSEYSAPTETAETPENSASDETPSEN